MPETKVRSGQLGATLSSKTIDNTNTINTDLTKLAIAGGTNGQVLSTNGSSVLSWATAGGGGGGLGAPTYVITKATNETVTNSTTTQDDDELFQALTANKNYRYEFRLLLTRTNTASSQGFRFRVDGTGGATPWDEWGSFYASPGFIWGRGTTDSSQNITTFPGSCNPVAAAVLDIIGTIRATDVHTLKLQFAQSTASATNGIVICKGSQLFVWEINSI